MPAIYISYRKEDTQGAAAHLYKNLSESFGAGAVQMDVTRSQPGRDVRGVIDEHLAASAVLLVVIGKGWAGAVDEAGQRRLDSTMDLVRIETAAALKRNLPVIPVLVQGAAMVQPAELPPELADLAFRNPVTLLQSQWGSDVETLVTLLQSLVQGQGAPLATAAAERPRADSAPGAAQRVRAALPQPVGPLPWRMMLAAMAAVVVVAIGVYAFMASRHPLLDQGVAQAQAQEASTAAAAKAEAAKAEAAKASAAKADAAKVDAAKADAAKADAAKANAAKADAAKADAAKAAALVADASKAAADQKAALARQAEMQAEQAAAAARTAAPRAESPAAPKPVAAEVPKPSPPPVAPPPPVLPPLTSTAAKALSFQKWTLNSGGCGAGPVTVTGTARFSIEKTSDAVVVTEEFRGSGSGYDVVVTGQVEFKQEQPSYDIPTAGVWTGTKVFKTTGTDRVTTSDGTTPRSANVVKFQSLCG